MALRATAVVEDDFGEALNDDDDALFLLADAGAGSSGAAAAAAQPALFLPGGSDDLRRAKRRIDDDDDAAQSASAKHPNLSLREAAPPRENLRRASRDYDDDDRATGTLKRSQAVLSSAQMRAEIATLLEAPSPARGSVKRGRDDDDDDIALRQGGGAAQASPAAMAAAQAMDASLSAKRDRDDNDDEGASQKRVTTPGYYSSSQQIAVHSSPVRGHAADAVRDLNQYKLRPQDFAVYLHERGIADLYYWQKRCLLLPDVARYRGRNLLVMAATSGGKTLIAEVMLLRYLLTYRENAIFILPYVSLVEEKIRQLEPLAQLLGFALEAYCGPKGRLPPRKHHGKQTLFIATFEKANALINHYIEKGTFLSEFGLVAVDELHMLDEDGGRGALLESTLAKVMYASDTASSQAAGAAAASPQQQSSPVQIVALSATLGNPSVVASFLRDARLFEEESRPVQIKETIIHLGKSYVPPKKDERVADTSPCAPWVVSRALGVDFPADDDTSQEHIMSLVRAVYRRASTLIFCGTRASAEGLALSLASKLEPDDVSTKKHQLDEERRSLLVESRVTLIQRMRHESADLYKPKLADCIARGFAFHHAGLTTQERTLIEQAYRDHLLSTIVCTSTLAAGVNLPAERVIIRSPEMGDRLLTKARYMQMIGRAGRTGLAAQGESYIFLKKKTNTREFMHMIQSPIEPCVSALHRDGERALKRLFLEAVCSKLISTRTDAARLYLHYTLASRTDHSFEGAFPTERHAICASESTHRCTERLQQMSLLMPDVERLVPHERGYAAFNAGIEPDLEAFVYRDLDTAAANLSLIGDFHMLYIVAPMRTALRDLLPVNLIDISRHILSSPDRAPITRIVTENIGISRETLVRLQFPVDVRKGEFRSILQLRAANAIPETSPLDYAPPETTIEKLKRISSAFVLQAVTSDERTVEATAATFHCTPAEIYEAMNAAAVYTNQLGHYASKVASLWQLSAILLEMPKRLLLGASRKNAPLMQIPGMTVERARILANAGYADPKAVATANPQQFHDAIARYGSERVAIQIQDAARRLLQELAEELREDAEDLLRA